MKNLILLVVASAFISLSACAQKDAPVAVKNVFSQKFAKAIDVKWDMEGKTEWEAEFKLDGKEYSANFDLKGTWLETEYKITENEIPAAIKTVIVKDYASSKIKAAEVSDTPKGKVVEVTFTKGIKNEEICFDVNGKVVKN